MYMFSEKLFQTMAEHLASDGFLAAGWQFVVMGDCWLAHARDSEGKLVPDQKRFPSGMPALAKFVSA